MAKNNVTISFRISDSADPVLYNKLKDIPVSKRNRLVKQILYEAMDSSRVKPLMDIAGKLDELDKLDTLINMITALKRQVGDIEVNGVVEKVDKALEEVRTEVKIQDSLKSMANDILGGW